MAFLSKVGNILRQSVNKKIGSDFLDSRLSICQAVRWMSSMSNPKLFVGGLSYNTDEQSLREAFAKYGEVSEARIIIDRETGRSRGFGFVSFNSSEEASSAIQALDGEDLHGRQIKVNYANDRVRGGGGYSGGDGGYSGGGGGYDRSGGGGYDRSGGGGYDRSGGGGYDRSGGGGYDRSGGGGYSGSGGGGYGGSGGGYSGSGGGYSGSGGGYSGGGGNSGMGYGSGGNYASNFGSDSQGSGGNFANNIGNDSLGSFGGNEAGGYKAGSNFAGGSGSGYGASSGLGYSGGDQFGSNENTINSPGDQNPDGNYQNNDDTDDFAKRA